MLLARAIALITAANKARTGAPAKATDKAQVVAPIPAGIAAQPLRTTFAVLQAKVTAATVTASQASAAAVAADARAIKAMQMADQLGDNVSSLSGAIRAATLSLYMSGRPTAVPNLRAGDGDAVMAAMIGEQIALSPSGMLAERKRVAANARQDAMAARRIRAEADVDAARAEQARASVASQVAAMRNALATLDTSTARALQAESTSVSQQAGKDLATASSLQFSTAGAIPPPVAAGTVALEWLFSELGKAYVWGGTGPDVFDCSGLTQFVWNKAGIIIPRVAIDQDNYAVPVALSDLLPGDLVFFGADVHHEGMYIGDGLMINAPHTGDVVRVSSMWWSDLIGFGRVYTPGTPIPPHTPIRSAPTTAVVSALGAVPSQTAAPPGAAPVTEPATPTTSTIPGSNPTPPTPPPSSTTSTRSTQR